MSEQIGRHKTSLPLDPKPVLWVGQFSTGLNRTGILDLLKVCPDAYSFAPRPEYSQDRKDYPNA